MSRLILVGLSAALFSTACSSGAGSQPGGSIAREGPADSPTGGTTGAVPVTAPVGTLPGAVTVSPSGTAGYSIPISVPPGIAGMEPGLSIGYSSGGSNGLLGVGFGLGGLSAITRCQPNLRDEGRVAPIEWRDADPLCLDGQRLIAVAGVSGKAGAEYRTRQDGNLRITEASDISSTASWFRVETPDGKILTFGRTDAAKVWAKAGTGGAVATAAVGTIYEWHLDRIEDRHRNAIAIEYAFASEDDGATRVDHRPTLIRYTERPGQEPLRSVAFGYERRADPWAGYMSGASRRQSWRLARIDTHGPTGRVFSYQLAYHYGALTGRSLLSTVTAVAADGVALPATRFDWQEGEQGVTAQPYDWANNAYSFSGADMRNGNNGPFPGDLSRLWGDFTGDGKSDLVTLQRFPNDFVDDDEYPTELHQGYWLLWTNSDSLAALYQPIDTKILGGIPEKVAQTELAAPIYPAVIDYNGDGKADILAPRVHEAPSNNGAGGYVSTAGSLDILVSTGAGFTPLHLDDNDPESRRFLQVYGLDLNGDALSDVAYCRDSLLYASAIAEWNSTKHGDNPWQEWAQVFWPRTGTWMYALNQPNQGIDLTQAVDTRIHCAVDTATEVIDRNGDGAQDLLVYEQGGIEPTGTYSALTIDFAAHTATMVDTGLPYDYTQRWCDPSATWGGEDDAYPKWAAGLGMDKPFDMNGDGLVDIVRFEYGAGDTDSNRPAIKTCLGSHPNTPWEGRWRVWTNTGTTFVPGPTLLLTSRYDDLDDVYPLAAPVDWNSDGRGDLLLPDPAAIPNDFGYFWKVLVAQPGDSYIMADTEIPYYNDLAYGYVRGAVTPTVDLNGDGLNDVASYWWGGHWWSMFLHKGEVPDLVKGVTNGLGEVTKMGYLPMTRTEVYRDAPEGQLAVPVSYPVARPPSSRALVRWLDNDPGVDGPMRTTRFSYYDARVDLLGRGGLGFGQRHVQQKSVADHQDQRVAERYDNSTYDPAVRDYPYRGAMVASVAQTIDFAEGSDSLADASAYAVYTTASLQHVNAGATYHVAPLARSTRTYEVSLAGTCGGDYCLEFELAGAPAVTSSLAGFVIDDYGNVLTATENTASRQATATTTYLNDPSTWRIGLPVTTRIDEQRGNSASFREQTRTYDVYGDLQQAVVEPNDDKYKLTATIWRYATGNPWVVLTEDAAGTMRWAATEYDQEGVFPVSVNNALGHTTTMTWNRGLGVPATTLDPNGLLATTWYDGFGRTLERSVTKDGGAAAPPANASYKRIEVAPGEFRTRLRAWQDGGADTTTELDRLGRNVTSQTTGLDGDVIVNNVDYDHFGRVARAYLPTKQGQPSAGYTAYAYDSRSRPTLVTAADETFTSYLYGFLEQWVTDATGITTYAQINDLGEVIRTSGGFLDGGDGDGPDDVMCYEYRPFGSLHRTIPCEAKNNPSWTGPQAIITERDRYSNLETLVDERTGTRQSRYNAFGELIETTDAKGQVARLTYDVLGRLVQRDDAPSGQVTTWSYDQGKKGLLDVSHSPSGTQVRYTYDEFARPVRAEQFTADETFGVGFQYDPLGRLGVITYPSPSPALAPFRVRNEYDAHGHFRAVWDDVTGALYHRADTTNEFGEVTDESFGNGAHTARDYEPLTGRPASIATLVGNSSLLDLSYEWDAVGNLARRSDNLFNQHEELRYDRKHRLIESKVVKGGTIKTNTFDYDPWGNFTQRSDVGTYTYASNQRLTSAGNANFWYDTNGSLVARVKDGKTTSLVYTPFGKPASIHLLPDSTIALEYDADGTRVRRTSDADDGSETIYVGGLYERQRVGTQIAHKYKVTGASGLVANVTREFAAPDLFTSKVDFVHADHLGTPSVIADANGEVVSRHAYDAWGQAIDATNWLALAPESVSSSVNVGFTGHEAQEDAGFIQMRGRHYDPTIGRFLSADPMIQAPFDARSLNRYSYVWNNPLTNTDPSGYNAVGPPATRYVECDDDLVKGDMQGGGQGGSSSAQGKAEGTTASQPATATPENATPANDNRAASFVVGLSPEGDASGTYEQSGNQLHLTYFDDLVRGDLPEPEPEASGVVSTVGTLAWDFTGGKPMAAVRAVTSAYDGDWLGAGLEVAGMAVPGGGAAAKVAKRSGKSGRKVVTLGGPEAPRLYKNKVADDYADELLLAARKGVPMYVGKSDELMNAIKDGPVHFMFGMREKGGPLVMALVESTNHSVLAGGRNALAAGHVTIGPGGVVTALDNLSGHYKPDPTSLSAAMASLRHSGFDVSNVNVTAWSELAPGFMKKDENYKVPFWP